MNLYVDGLNYASVFFSSKNTTGVKLTYGFQKVKNFCQGMKNSGYKLKVFIDGTQKTLEAQKKWTQRREKVIQKGPQIFPHAVDLLLSNSFQKCGVPVVYSLDEDNDDVLAALAQRDGASILSRDKDFFRYNDSTFSVYDHFEVQRINGQLKCEISSKQGNKGNTSSKRNLLAHPLTVYDDYKSVHFTNIVQKHIYKRGDGTPLVKRIENPHLVLRPLRQALYSRLGISSVIEILPIWKDSKVSWVRVEVEKDSRFDTLLDKPYEAYTVFFPKRPRKPGYASDRDWSKHLFSSFSMTMEICCFAKDGGQSFFESIFSTYNKVIGDSGRPKPYELRNGTLFCSTFSP